MAAPKYSIIIIIYNPNSTGEAPAKAKRLHARLEKKGQKSILHATERAGHAEEIAYEAAKKYQSLLIVSVSGDGGYNEVVNGIMRAQDEEHAKKEGTKDAAQKSKLTRRPVCTIVSAGNANDHRRSVRKRPVGWAILHTPPEAIDILRLTATNNQGSQGRSLTRYAHSYIGFGLTSQAAAGLNRESLTRWKETKIVMRTLLNFNPVKIEHEDGRVKKYDSLVCANIHQMSKVIRLGKKTNLHNGLFRVVALPHRNRPRMLLTILSILIFGYKHPPQTAAYSFRLPYAQPAHFDGEIVKIPGRSNVKIACAPEALLTIR